MKGWTLVVLVCALLVGCGGATEMALQAPQDVAAGEDGGSGEPEGDAAAWTDAGPAKADSGRAEGSAPGTDAGRDTRVDTEGDAGDALAEDDADTADSGALGADGAVDIGQDAQGPKGSDSGAPEAAQEAQPAPVCDQASLCGDRECGSVPMPAGCLGTEMNCGIGCTTGQTCGDNGVEGRCGSTCFNHWRLDLPIAQNQLAQHCPGLATTGGFYEPGCTLPIPANGAAPLALSACATGPDGWLCCVAPL